MVSKPKFNIVLGTNVRSRNGCINCKKSKKKCDEQFPTCGLCSRRSIGCSYENFRSTTVEKRSNTNTIKFVKDRVHKNKRGPRDRQRSGNVANVANGNGIEVFNRDGIESDVSHEVGVKSYEGGQAQEGQAQEGQAQEGQRRKDDGNEDIIPLESPTIEHSPIPFSLEDILMSFSASDNQTEQSQGCKIQELDGLNLEETGERDDNEVLDGINPSLFNSVVETLSSSRTIVSSPAEASSPEVHSPLSLSQLITGPASPSQLISQTHLPSVTMSSPFSLYLDETGIQFLQYFEEKVSNLLCIDKNSSNYFVKTFLQVSFTEESISNALACWGGVFKSEGGLNNHLVKRHLDKSVKLFEDFPLKNDVHYYVLLCYYQIMIGIQVCQADVKYWHTMFENCYKLIDNNGGITELMKRFHYSNDVKWLVSNFQYHDVLCSDAFIFGTKYQMEDYNMSFDDYGVDPYQGCNNEIIAMIGDILNEKNRLSHYGDLKEWNDIYTILSSKLDSCQPIGYQLKLIQDTSKENYIVLFELYKQCANILLLMYFKRLPPYALDIQLLVQESLGHIERLLNLNVISCLTFPALLVGVNVLGAKKLKYLKLIDNLMPIYRVGNLVRVKQVVLEYWDKNPDGMMVLDWVDIVQRWNWNLGLA